jgi:hypothetical protein
MSKQEIKEILLHALMVGIIIGTMVCCERVFYKYLYNDNNIVEESREEKSVSNSFCYPSRNKDMQPVMKCRWDTPETLMRLYGYMPTRRV